MDEVCRRAVTLAAPRRFVCLTFDGGYKDLMTSAYPVLSRHGVPFTVYVPTAFPDGLGEAWWLALEAVIARENRLSLVMDRKERHFDIANYVRKISALRFSRELDALACAARSFVRDQRSLQAILGRSRGAVARGVDGLGRSGEACGRSAGDDRKCDGELSRAVEPEGCRCAARDDDGQGGRAGRVPPRCQAFRLSVRRSRILAPATCRDGRGGRLCQRGIGDTGRRRDRRAEPICTRCRASPGTDGSVRCAPCA